MVLKHIHFAASGKVSAESAPKEKPQKWTTQMSPLYNSLTHPTSNPPNQRTNKPTRTKQRETRTGPMGPGPDHSPRTKPVPSPRAPHQGAPSPASCVSSATGRPPVVSTRPKTPGATAVGLRGPWCLTETGGIHPCWRNETDLGTTNRFLQRLKDQQLQTQDLIYFSLFASCQINPHSPPGLYPL